MRPFAVRTVVYWLAVLAVSSLLVLGLILLLERRDAGSLEAGAGPAGGVAASAT
jgi:hypothetical protein